MNIQQSLDYLREKHSLTVMAHSGDKKWYNLSRDDGVGCILKETEGNVTFQMCFSLPYGHFYYQEMHVSHLGRASRLAIRRIKRILRRIEDERHA